MRPANLGVELLEIAIEAGHRGYDEMLRRAFAGREPDITEENLQARIRGNLLMALSNKFGWLVLTTGNKSEVAVGYSTLYGDSAGGFAVIKDVPKTLVYRLVDCRNAQRRRSIRCRGRSSTGRRAPSCAPDQKDADSLPRLRRPRRDPRGLRRGGRRTASSSARRATRRRRRARDRAGRPRRVQAPPAAAGR